MITSQNLLKTLPIGKRRTLIRWHRAGLIPPPVNTEDPSHGKVMSCWPDWVTDRCRRILIMKELGYSLIAIRTALGTDWEAEERAWQASQKPVHATKKADKAPKHHLPPKSRQQVTEAIWKRVCEATNQPAVPGTQFHRTFVQPLLDTDLLDIAYADALRGFRVFLLFDGVSVSVVRDVDIGMRLGTKSERDICFIVPLQEDLRSLTGKQSLAMPADPCIFPSHEAEYERGARRKRLTFCLVGDNQIATQPKIKPVAIAARGDVLIPAAEQLKKPRRSIIRNPPEG